MITIYGNNNAIVYKGNAVVTYKGRLMGEQTLTVSIVSKNVIPFAFGCYADTEIERFYLYQVPTQTINEAYIEYTLVMESAKYELIRAEMLSFGASEYSLTTTMQGWLQLLCENVNRVVGGGWSYQINDANDEYKTLEITGENTLAALNRINSDFGKEFYVQGKIIYVGKRGVTHSLTLAVGRWKGLYNLTLEGISNQNPITRLYLYGSEKNLPSNYQNADGKPITKRLVVDAVNGGKRYIDSPNISKFGVNEGRKTFDDVWPHRTGTVTAVTDNLTFTDSSIDFDINAQLISGTSCKLQFKTGDLAGYDFELVSYNHTNKVIKIKSITDSTGLAIPNDTIKIKAGDKYVLFDLIMPQIYITNAETDLKAKGVDWLVNQKNDDYQVKYTANSLDLVFCRDNGFTPFEGDYVPIKDARLGIDRLIRIVEVNIDLSGPYKDYKSVELSDNIEPTAAQQFVQDNVSRDTLIKVNDKRRKDDIRRGWSAMDELRENIFDQSGYFDATKIKPGSVETNMLTVGAKESRMTLNGVTILANYLAMPNDLRIVGGTLYHFSIPDTSGREWIVSNGVASLADNNYRHIYARCSKGDNTASIVFDTQQLPIDGDGYYYFLLGGLSSVVDGVRRINLTYGQGSFVGEQLNIGKVSDPQGREFFNINERKVKGAITFESGSSGLENLAEWSAKQTQINNAQAEAAQANSYINSVLPTTIAGLQNQIDGVVDSWFYAYTPSISNIPASDWTTDAIKDRHIGDTFTNTQPFVDNATTPDAGKSWRFVKNSGVYSWTPIADSDAVKALQNAAKAQDTADSKRRTFTTQPTNDKAYDVGDFWSNATFGTIYSNDLLKCKTAKPAGAAFDISHWELATKYTDDTVANAAITASNNAQAAATTALQSANAANSSISDQRNYIDGAFKDGVVSEAEAAAIDKLNKQINSEFDRAIADYNSVYTNTYLVGAAKTDLLNSKINLVAAKDALQTSINNAIADGKTTAAEKADVDSKFATYKNAFTDYQTKLSNAGKAVQVELDRLAGVKVDAIQVGGRNLFKKTTSVDVFLSGGVQNTVPEASHNYANNGLDILTIQGGLCTARIGNVINENGHYTYSFWAKTSVDTFNINVDVCDSGIKTFQINGTSWTYCSGTVYVDRYSDIYNFIDVSGLPYAIVYLKNVKVEKGSKATDWTPAPEDIDTAITDAKIAAANAQADAITAKARTEGLSGFDGGLGFANLFKLMPVGATVESAGMNGQPTDAAGASLPAVYAGGDFSQAIAGVCNLIFKHNGDGKVGDFYVDSNGTVCVKENGVNKVIITRGVISSLAQLFGSSTSGSVANAADSCNVDGTTTKIFTNKLVVANNNTSVTVKSHLTAHADGLGNNAIGNCFVKLCLINEASGAEILLDSISAYCNGNIDSKSVAVNKTLLLSSGTYALNVYYINRTTNNAYLEGGVWETTISWYYSATAQRTEIGKNGFATIADISNFIYAALEPDGFKLMIRGTGNKIDIPGILATGSVSSGASDSNKWGAKSSGSTSTKLGTGQYRVYHNVGKLGYTVGLTSTTDSVDARCVGKGSNYIDVNCRNSSNVLVDASFDYELKGDNQ